MKEPVLVYLSRKNLLSLLGKLDGKKQGIPSTCTIVKYDNVHPKYPQSHEYIAVTALEDEEYYTDRAAGVVREGDLPGTRYQ